MCKAFLANYNYNRAVGFGATMRLNVGTTGGNVGGFLNNCLSFKQDKLSVCVAVVVILPGPPTIVNGNSTSPLAY